MQEPQGWGSVQGIGLSLGWGGFSGVQLRDQAWNSGMSKAKFHQISQGVPDP